MCAVSPGILLNIGLRTNWLQIVVNCDHTDVMDLEFRYRDFNFIHGIGHGNRNAGRGIPSLCPDE